MGHAVNKEGISPDPEKLQAVKKFPTPDLTAPKSNKVKHIQSCLGLIEFDKDLHLLHLVTVTVKKQHQVTKLTQKS